MTVIGQEPFWAYCCEAVVCLWGLFAAEDVCQRSAVTYGLSIVSLCMLSLRKHCEGMQPFSSLQRIHISDIFESSFSCCIYYRVLSLGNLTLTLPPSKALSRHIISSLGNG